MESLPRLKSTVIHNTAVIPGPATPLARSPGPNPLWKTPKLSVSIREQLVPTPLPVRPVFTTLTTVATKRSSAPKLSICLLSPHPLVLSEFERILSKPDFKVISKQLESTLAPDLRSFEPPKAQVYVIDAHAARQATGALLSNILERHPDARLIVVGEAHQDANSFSLLRLGVKGILTYTEARDQLIRALPLVATGGFWVPRTVLSGFVDSILSGQTRRLKSDSVANLSRREQEVLDSLLENLSNKEIASKLNIAERTVKFHVSNLLNKFGVRRRADLILLTFQRRMAPDA
jgi:DNA-binding NarL/FixJ family response regulator